MSELYQAYRGAAVTIIEAYGGCAAQFVGDGILAYFGYPQAHEDDAVRAVRAALEIGPAVRRLDGVWNKAERVELNIRAGVHTGVVVVGTLGSGVHADPLAVVGGTSNVAARIQNYAEPGAVMITGATLRLIEGRFECEDLGRHPMRGIREPVHILRVRRPSDRLTRFEAAAALTDLVGRETEIGRILAGWERAEAGKGQIVRLSGEPGIGKSRLVRAVEERVAVQPHRILRCQCSPFTTQSTLYPVVVGLRRAAAFLPDDSPDERLDKLETLLAAAGQPVRAHGPALCGPALPAGGAALPAAGADAGAAEGFDARRHRRSCARPGGTAADPGRGRGCPLDRSDLAGAARPPRPGDRRQPDSPARHLQAGIRPRPAGAAGHGHPAAAPGPRGQPGAHRPRHRRQGPAP